MNNKTNQTLARELHLIADSLSASAIDSLQWGNDFVLNLNDLIALQALSTEFAKRFAINEEA